MNFDKRTYVKLIFSLFVFICSTFVRIAESLNTFSAITDGGDQGIEDIYWKLVVRARHLQPDSTVDSETKKRICESITRNAYFDKFMQEDPVDMNANYDNLRATVEAEKSNAPSRLAFYKNVLRDYSRRQEDGYMVFRYSTMSIPVQKEQRVREFAFACMTRNRHFESELNIYFITDPYDVNAALDLPISGGQIRARFICQPLPSYCLPWLLAEEPATAFGGPKYPAPILEYIYQQSRNAENFALSPSRDPICGLSKSQKLRICASVMNSSFFANTIIFNPAPYLQSDVCQLNKVSLQMAVQTTAVAKESLIEWMLPCAVEPIIPGDTRNKYYVSRAYCSHHAIVYSRTSKSAGWNIENISGGISVIIDEPGGTRGTPSANVADLLRMLQDSAGPSGS